MSFRRSKAAAQETRAWHDFLDSNAVLFQGSGVPSSLYRSRELFDDLLMHGYIDHHTDPTYFGVGQLSASQQATLIEVVVRYLQAGFPDPGIGGFMGGPIRDEILRRVGFDAKSAPPAGDWRE